ncbi:MAG TPA: DUF3325 family protein [Methylibium sp.]|uniref:DUF3325 family protein n=1 Tax=Methylibium sp. TaxID=2067992 RepID=UPI002DBDE475|nr:DUF3325 family protein [Methylibium sp.]HEU4457587.1 DUF3325 family protein [Methylibium sp.]
MSAWAQLACAAAGFAGWLAWALTLERHRDAAAPGTAAPRSASRHARALAAALLLAAGVIAIAHEGWSFGVLSAVAWLGVSGFAVVLLLAWWPHRAPSLLRAGWSVLAAAALAWGLDG